MTNLVATDDEDEMEKAKNSICPGSGMVCCHHDKIWNSNPSLVTPSPHDQPISKLCSEFPLYQCVDKKSCKKSIKTKIQSVDIKSNTQPNDSKASIRSGNPFGKLRFQL